MIKIYILSFLISFPIMLFGYSNCHFKQIKYKKLCTKMLNNKIDINYINEMLLQDKNKEIDTITLRLFKPEKISYHKNNEKKANNTLVKHIDKIHNHLSKYKKVYDFTEKKYKVNREIIAAILTKETWLGKIKPKHDAWIVFNSLYLHLKKNSKRNKRLINMGEKNLIYITKYCFKNNIKVKNCTFKSSYAGAVGIPQFMPMNFGLIEGYKKKLGNLNNMEDAIVSTGKFLHYNSKFTRLIDFNKFHNVKNIEEQWYNYSFKKHNKSNYFPTSTSIDNFVSTYDEDLSYFNNYLKKILKYNNSINYAIGVLRISNDLHNY